MEPTTEFSIDDLLRRAHELEASDLHVTPGTEPVVRVRGRLVRLDEYEKLTPDLTRELIYRILSTNQQKTLETKRNVDLAYSLPGVARFRVNAFFQRQAVGAAFRMIPSEIKSLDELGLPGQLADLAAKPRGLVLVTGPTGSGKTTTLYALLRRLATGERNVLTIEDPVEYQLPGVGQMPVNPRIGLGFAGGLRAILRQDPDVILVGEIRDRETVEIALRAALTGHLVFSTLHTNDAASAMTRLLDMDVEPFLISSSILAVLAQRLVRLACPACVRLEPPTDAERHALGTPAPDAVPHAGPGCDACRGTGYRRRAAIHELLLVDDAVRALVMERRDAATIRRHVRAAGAGSLRDAGLARVRAGATTVDEVLRVTQDEA